MAISGAAKTAKAAGLTFFALNFVIESALFSDFLHQEAVQLTLNTLKVARMYLPCAEYKYLYNRAEKHGLNAAIQSHNEWGWINPWSRDTFDMIYQKASSEFRSMKPGC